MEPPTGAQFEIRSAGHRAVVVEVGAGLREYTVDGHAVLDGFALESMPDGGRGQPLLPWPNRLDEGRYEFNRQSHQLPIDEIGRNNASHGLTRWLNWTLVSHTDAQVELQQTIHPRPGYPFILGLRITYALDSHGLTVSTQALNLGTERLPFGAGQHPYFTVGSPTVDSTVLQIPARVRLQLDSERRLPTGQQLSVEGTELDFRTARPIGATVLDECYTNPERDEDGLVRVTLASNQRKLTVWMREPYRYVQVFSGDTLAAQRRRQGLAVEPMTCPPNAFRTGIDLIVLEPGAAVDLEWGVAPEF